MGTVVAVLGLAVSIWMCVRHKRNTNKDPEEGQNGATHSGGILERLSGGIHAGGNVVFNTGNNAEVAGHSYK